MKQKILLFFIVVVQIFAFWQWSSCHDFVSPFHFSSFDLQLRLIESIHNDQTTPLWQVRFFHNKVSGFLFDIFGHYLQFWSVQFLASFVGIAGVVGLGSAFYHFFANKKSVRVWIVFLLLILIPFIEIFQFTKQFSLSFRLAFIGLPYLLWSMWGYWKLMKKVTTKTIVVILIVSLWYQFALSTIMFMCQK